jgi:O-antigen ligase
VETPLIEGGFEKVLVELGIVGTLAVVVFAGTLAWLGYLTFRRIRRAHGDTTPLAALSAFVLCNVATFFIAFQVYGDPFIGFLLGFAAGLTLSASRLAAQRPTAPDPTPA